MGCDAPTLYASPHGHAIVVAQTTAAISVLDETPTQPFGEHDVFFGILKP